MRAAIVYTALSLAAPAGDPPEDPRTGSPDAQFRIGVAAVGNTNMRRLEIRTASGKVLHSSPPSLDGTDIPDFSPEHLRWSPDSKIPAIAAGYSKHIRTYLFVWDGSRSHHVSAPPLAADYDNPWIVPTGRPAGHRLSLKITGPHAGKATGGGYSGTATIMLDPASKKAKPINEHVENY